MKEKIKMPIELDERRKLSLEQIDSMVGFIIVGETFSSVAKKFGVNRGTVYHHFWKRFDPMKFRQMEGRKVIRNRKYARYNLDYTHTRKTRLRKVFGIKKAAKYLQDIKDKWIEKNPQKFLEYRRKYRHENRKKINENWNKNYHKKRLT